MKTSKPNLEKDSFKIKQVRKSKAKSKQELAKKLRFNLNELED